MSTLRGIYKYQFTKKEKDVVKLMYKTLPEIAKELNLPYGTVKSRINRVLYKTDTKNKTQAILTALKLGYVELDDFDC